MEGISPTAVQSRNETNKAFLDADKDGTFKSLLTTEDRKALDKLPQSAQNKEGSKFESSQDKDQGEDEVKKF